MTFTRRRFRRDERIAARSRAVQLYADGHTIRCIGATIGRPYTTVHNLLADADTVFRTRGHGSRCTADHPEVVR